MVPDVWLDDLLDRHLAVVTILALLIMLALCICAIEGLLQELLRPVALLAVNLRSLASFVQSAAGLCQILINPILLGVVAEDIVLEFDVFVELHCFLFEHAEPLVVDAVLVVREHFLRRMLGEEERQLPLDLVE